MEYSKKKTCFFKILSTKHSVTFIWAGQFYNRDIIQVLAAVYKIRIGKTENFSQSSLSSPAQVKKKMFWVSRLYLSVISINCFFFSKNRNRNEFHCICRSCCFCPLGCRFCQWTHPEVGWRQGRSEAADERDATLALIPAVPTVHQLHQSSNRDIGFI